ncbi:MAG: thiosulfohydrolase SoxB [Methylicorpusculum sp.]|uniref:thiosulfohydrolase SoxB n=1 Tax=Methylicorpusculum sp. TaxID=2713644 RepID=UPI00271764B2|nr:thiosulfohydrolase SoxB [Methylicorpusculum sp.]MDO8939223.1 thiosulfohydrolase SoxB [Methylicorpusculum sp.]MDP2201049.1 thiosulfohydrolase SoxB [Methylicorpusculum sp.]
MNRRDFIQTLATAMMLSGCSARQMLQPSKIDGFYNQPPFGHCSLLHLTDCHAQLMPVYYREPDVSFGAGEGLGQPPHLAGQALLDHYGFRPQSIEAHAFTHLDFVEAARVYGKVGGFAHLAALVKKLTAERGTENTLLLDGGDSWQGSATALWTQGRDMVAAANLLGVDIMTGHWEFTYGPAQVMENLKSFNGEFVAQNIALTEEALFERDLENPGVFKSYVIKQLGQTRVAVIGQAFPYTAIANPKRFVPDWQFGIEEQNLQLTIDEIKRLKAADVIVLLSHNGLDVDVKLASQVSGLDFILGGHTHDALPIPFSVKNRGGQTWVTNAGSHGKFLAVLDLDIVNGRLRDFRYRLLPVFANLLPPDPDMQGLIDSIRAPHLTKLQTPVAVADQLLFRRDNFHGTFDQLILDALMTVHDAEIAFSPGFRWGHTVLPGDEITFEDIMNHTAITYPETSIRRLKGHEIKSILEDVADNLFNKDPYYRQGGDMVRVGGMTFRCNPGAAMGSRISDLALTGSALLQANKTYKVAGWAGVGEPLSGAPVWDAVVKYLKS